MTAVTELIVPRRYCGPPDSGNGGWTAGSLAALHPALRAAGEPAAIEVSLRRPPPLDTPLLVAEEDGLTSATSDGVVVATARRAESEPPYVEPVAPDAARAAEASYPGLAFHPFPTCFACGTDREEGDGLRIWPGPVGGGRVAATWTPDPSLAQDGRAEEDDARVSVPATWASLDCVGGWAGDLTERLMVLGRMTARIDSLPVIGEEHVVVGEALGHEGRKTFTAATLHDADGRVVATARHVWIAVDPAAFGGSTPAR